MSSYHSGHLFLCLVALQSHFVPFFIIYRKKGARGMLKERIRTDCGNGDNCSQVILRAVAEEYGISLSEELFCACRGIHGGFGINGMCSGIVAGVMALGLLCEEELKLKRILFLLRVQNRFGSLDCCTLSALGADCSGILEEIGGILQEVIEE